jgi:hypothetical protein
VNRPAFPILVLGGYGVFGSRVVRLLARDHGLRLIIGGRNLHKSQALARRIEHEGASAALAPIEIDAFDHDFARRLVSSGAALVVNAAGPFQGQDYRVARACIASGIHYLDLADSQDFVSGFAKLNPADREAGITAVTGASTVPAVSAAVIDALSPAFAQLDGLDIAISPGGRAPRGPALIRAILKRAGKPLPRWQDGRWTTVRGWHDLGRRTISGPGLGSLGGRWLSACDAPDNVLLPERYPGVRTVRFRAGVEQSALHLGLWALSWLPAFRLIGSLQPLAGPCRAVSGLFQSFGSDRGGMVVELSGVARGRTANLTRRWSLIAEQGDGPWIPAVPAVILARRLAAGERLPSGAMACLGLITLEEFEAATAHLAIGTAVEEAETAPLYRRVLGDRFEALPEPIRRMHDVAGWSEASGRGRVERGQTWLAAFICRLFGLPPAGADIPVTVRFQALGEEEHWRRRFGSHRMNSVQCEGRGISAGLLLERFGPMTIGMEVETSASGLTLHTKDLWLSPVPLPRALWPRVRAREHVANGRFRFDVEIAAPLAGRLVRYEGWLEPT